MSVARFAGIDHTTTLERPLACHPFSISALCYPPISLKINSITEPYMAKAKKVAPKKTVKKAVKKAVKTVKKATKKK